jgi:transposase
MLLLVRVQPAMKCPEQMQLSHADGEVLRTRLAGDALTADDRRVLDQVLQWYFWLLFALQEATFSLKRLRAMLFGEKPNKRKTSPPPGASADVGGGPGGTDSDPAHAVAEATQATEAERPPSAGKRRSGHGRQGAETYRGAEHVVCRHETLAAGERCPVCGRGRL